MGKICILGEGLGVHVELGGLEMFGSYDDFVFSLLTRIYMLGVQEIMELLVQDSLNQEELQEKYWLREES